MVGPWEWGGKLPNNRLLNRVHSVDMDGCCININRAGCGTISSELKMLLKIQQLESSAVVFT